VEDRKIGAKKEMPANPERREFLRTGAALLLAAAAGCRGLYSREPESVVFNQNNRANLSAQELGFVRGQTTLLDAEYGMEQRELTHIAKDTNVTGDKRIDALTADYQHSVHIFVDGKYERSLELEIARGEFPHRYALRVANIPGDGFLVMVLIRDAIEIEPTRLFMVPYSGGEFEEPLRADLTELENRHNGLERPLFVGYDLGFGITFIARDRDGIPWENGYIIKWEDGRITKRPVPFLELMQCSCVSDWAEGNEEE
jgi:hypothetical protein